MRKNTSSDERMRNQCADIFLGSPQVRVLSPRPEEHPLRVFFFIFLKKIIVRTFTHSLCYNEITEENLYFN